MNSKKKRKNKERSKCSRSCIVTVNRSAFASSSISKCVFSFLLSFHLSAASSAGFNPSILPVVSPSAAAAAAARDRRRCTELQSATNAACSSAVTGDLLILHQSFGLFLHFLCCLSLSFFLLFSFSNSSSFFSFCMLLTPA